MKSKLLTVSLTLLAAGAALFFSACGIADPEGNKPEASNEVSAEESPLNSFLAELYTRASEQLDLTVEALTEALGTSPNLRTAAEKLGVAVEKLTEAIPFLAPDGGGGGKPGSRGDGGGDRIKLLAEAAKKLEITAGDLMKAIGNPPNLEAAAATLEIPVEELQEALPFFRRVD